MSSRVLTMATDLPKLVMNQALRPLRLAFRKPIEPPQTQKKLAEMVNHAVVHEIRAGYTHRFITLLFVTVDDRVFCRRYSYNEPSWHSAFRSDSAGQVKLDKTIVNIAATVPEDMETIIPEVDKAYADKLKKFGARFLLMGAVEPRAQESTLELFLADRSASEREEGAK